MKIDRAAYILLAMGAVAIFPLVAADPGPKTETLSRSAPAKTNRHLKLCAQLGLKAGNTYEFMISGNEEVHYWTIRSLGAKGWILVKDSRYPGTWLNLSRVIAVTPVNVKAAANRAEKTDKTVRAQHDD